VGEKDPRDVRGMAYAAGWRDGYRSALLIRGIRLSTRDEIRRDVARFVEAQRKEGRVDATRGD
jgi:hypothetical protein